MYRFDYSNYDVRQNCKSGYLRSQNVPHVSQSTDIKGLIEEIMKDPVIQKERRLILAELREQHLPSIKSFRASTRLNEEDYNLIVH